MVKKLKSFFSSSPKAGATKEAGAFPWIPLEGPDELERLLEPGGRTGVIFKHSTRCGLSGMMLRRFQQNWDQARDRADFYLLDLVRHRGLSKQIADRFEVPHQSPQVLIVEGGKVCDHDSHGGIDRLRPEPESKNPA